MSKNIKRINQRVLKFQESENSWYNVIEKTTTEFDKNFNKIKEITNNGDEWIYKYSFDDKNRITSVLMCNENYIGFNGTYFNYDGEAYEKKYFYDEYGNNIRIDEIDFQAIEVGSNYPCVLYYTKNIFKGGKLVKSNTSTNYTTYFEYDDKGFLYKKTTDCGDETYFNPDGTIEKELETGSGLLGPPYESYLGNFIAFEYDNNGNEIAGKSGSIGYDYPWDNESQNRLLVFDYNRIEIKVTWKILYTFDKFENWITKLYIVNDKPSTLIEREIEYYD